MMINNETNKTNTEVSTETDTIKLFKEIGLPIILVVIIVSCSIAYKYLIKSNTRQSLIKHFLPKKKKLKHIEEILNDSSFDDIPIPSNICLASSSSSSFECIELYKI